MFTRITFAIVAAATVCVLAAACLADAGSAQPGTFVGPSTLVPSASVVGALRVLHPYRLQMLADRLKLSEEQKAKVADVLNQSEEALKPLILNQRKAAEECVIALTKPGLHESDVILAAERAAKAETEILVQKIKTLFAVRALLTSEQVKNLNDMIDHSTVHWRSGPGTSGTATQPPRNAPTPVPGGPE